jgi:hypothetical protein
MEKIMLGLLFIFLNVGLYLVIVLDDRLRIRRNLKMGFFLFFIVIYIVWEIAKLPYLDIMRISISLLGLYLIGAVIMRFILKFFQQKNEKVERIIRTIVFFGVMPIYTLMTTIVQILLLLKC